MLVVWLDEIPRELWWARPGLVLAHASLLFGEGRYEEAWEALEKALETLIERGEQQRAALAFLRLLQVALAAGTPERGLEASPPARRPRAESTQGCYSIGRPTTVAGLEAGRLTESRVRRGVVGARAVGNNRRATWHERA